MTEQTVWKRLKIQSFLEEDTRILQQPISQIHESGSSGGVYSEKPTQNYPFIPPQVGWLYTIDMDDGIFSVSLVNYSTRSFHLTNIPRGLFLYSSATSTKETWMENGYHVFINPVPNLHLVAAKWLNPAFITLYQSYAPKLRPLHTMPSIDTFPVRKYLRLVLLKHFFDKHQSVFRRIGNNKPIHMSMFRQLVYGIVNLARSSVEVSFRTGERTAFGTNSIIDSGNHPNATEYWVDGVLIIQEWNISVTEIFQAAVVKAVKITSGYPPAQGTIPSAVICSLNAIVFVYIQGEEVSHTHHLHFFPHSTIYEPDEVQTAGVLALLDIFYRPPPSPPAAPLSFPGPFKHLPTEICQDIFFYASSSTRSALRASCRLFRAISHDHGVKVGDHYLQQRSAENGSTAFIGSMEYYECPERELVRTMYTRRTVVYLIQQSGNDMTDVVALRLPDSQVIKFVLPVVAGVKSEGFPPEPQVAPWAQGT